MARWLGDRRQRCIENSATLGREGRSWDGSAERSYFPEALYINRNHYGQGRHREHHIPLADSITTWRMSMMASTTRGALGSGTSSIKVFQDFSWTWICGDTDAGRRVSIPVAVYNYSGAAGDVNLQLQADDCFSLVDDVTRKRHVESRAPGESRLKPECAVS